MSGKSAHMLMTKSAFHFGRERFEDEKEKFGRSSFRIDDLLKKHSTQRFDEHEVQDTHHRDQSSPSPSTSPTSPPQVLQHNPFNIDTLSLAAFQHQHHRHRQQQLLQSSMPCSYPYNPLFKLGLNFLPTNNFFGRDFFNPYHPYGPSTFDQVPFFIRDRLLQYDSSGSRKCRRSRTVFSELQLMALEKRFEQQKYLSTPDRMELADALGLTQLQVKTWYQNRRMKWKKQVQQSDSSNESEQEKSANDSIFETSEVNSSYKISSRSTDHQAHDTAQAGSESRKSSPGREAPVRGEHMRPFRTQINSTQSSNECRKPLDQVLNEVYVPKPVYRV